MAYPNAGLPNELGEYDELPGETAALRASGRERPGQHRRRLLRHDAGAHRAIAEAVRGHAAARVPGRPAVTRLAGLEPMLAGLEPMVLAA
jgi:5-methyltetrahydrofolate--homocysteine methyltransferase